VSIHADDEFSLRIALEGELDDVVPADNLAGLVIARYHRTRRRRLAGAVGLVVVAAGIGVPLGLSGPSSGHNGGPHPGQGGAPDRAGLVPQLHTGAVPVIVRHPAHLAISSSSPSPAALVPLTSGNLFAIAA
jgi:hypothetical protein